MRLLSPVAGVGAASMRARSARTTRLRFAVAMLLSTFISAAAADGSGPAVASDVTAAMFDPDKILKVDIQIEEDEWNRLCGQRRTIVSLLRDACLSQPFPNPFTWFSGRVSIDGQARENVGIRKKGFLGSLDSVKPSLKISLARFQANAGIYGASKLTLNNAKQDPSLIRQCLGYQLFARAGVPAPRCNFADVKVNGRSLGIYVNVEDVRKPMLARYFSDTSGNLSEGTFSDFHTVLSDTFEAQTNELANDRTGMAAVMEALKSDDAELVNALGARIDLDAFVKFWAMEALVAQYDGYSSNRNNYYTYEDPSSGKFHFIPWGADTILMEVAPKNILNPSENRGIYAYSAITRRLIDVPEMRSRYLAQMQALLETVWNEAVIQAEIARMEALLAPYVGDLSAATTEVRNFVITQRARVLAGLANGVPAFPPLTILDFCLVPTGGVSGGFVASWGTAGNVPPFQTGVAALAGNVSGVDIASTVGSADAGGASIDHPNPYLGSLNLYFLLDNGGLSTVAATLNPTLLRPGGALAIDGQQVDAIFLAQNGASVLSGFLDKGTMKTFFASTDPGGKLCGTFEAQSYYFSLVPLTGDAAAARAAAAAPPFSSEAAALHAARQGLLGEFMRQCRPASPAQ